VKQDQIEAEIIAARERLAKNLSELEYALSPSGLSERGMQYMKKIFTDQDGDIRYERVLGAVLGTVLGLKIIKKIF